MKKSVVVRLMEKRIRSLREQLRMTNSITKITSLNDLIFTNLTILIKVDPNNELVKEFKLGKLNEQSSVN
jgi:hypothetical protein